MNNNSKIIFKENLKYLLKKNNLSGKDLSKILNVCESTISTWLKGNSFPTINALDKIADYFKIETYLLLKEGLNNENIKFTPDEIKELNNYIKFIKMKRNL